jgi:hypothetical protein
MKYELKIIEPDGAYVQVKGNLPGNLFETAYANQMSNLSNANEALRIKLTDKEEQYNLLTESFDLLTKAYFKLIRNT